MRHLEPAAQLRHIRAMSFPPTFLDQLRDMLPIAQVVGARIPLVKKGRESWACCPFHKEKTPSFHLREDRNSYYCFGCQASGDIISFVMQHDGLGFREAVSLLARDAGLALPEVTPQNRAAAAQRQHQQDALAFAADYFRRQLLGPLAEEARAYVRKRQLTRTSLDGFALGYAPDGGHFLQAALNAGLSEAQIEAAGLLRRYEDSGRARAFFRNRLIFPIQDRSGKTIAFGGRLLAAGEPKYLNSPDSPLFKKGQTLYGLSQARKAAYDRRSVIAVEGYMDVIALHQAGFTQSVAPLGTALTEAQLSALWALAPQPLLCLDGDAAGRRAALRAVERALPLLKPGRTLKLVHLPENEDPDSFIRAQGPAAFASLLEDAHSLSAYLFDARLAALGQDDASAQAQLWNGLLRDLKPIRDATLKQSLSQDFAQRFQARFGYNPLEGAAQVEGPDATLNSYQAYNRRRRSTPEPAYHRQVRRSGVGDGAGNQATKVERDLLGGLVQFPELLPSLADRLVDISWSQPEHATLANALIDAVVRLEHLDSQALTPHIKSKGCETIADLLLSDRTVVRVWKFEPEQHSAESPAPHLLNRANAMLDALLRRAEARQNSARSEARNPSHATELDPFA